MAYYLPLSTGARKKWGSEAEDFWCCNCTLLQANAVHHRAIYYQDGDVLTVAQYLSSETSFNIDGNRVDVCQTEGNISADTIRITPEAYMQHERPEDTDYIFQMNCEHTAAFTLRLRKPWWICGVPKVQINGLPVMFGEDDKGFIHIVRTWKDGDVLRIRLEKCLSVYPLQDRPDTVAFMDGPVVLAGLCSNTPMLYGDMEHPEDIMRPDDERAWGSWNKNYRTINQPIDIKFKPLYDIGDEANTVYYQVSNRMEI